jgi:hypothetical protein
MPRAFLSHSTDDKAFVNEVAERLGRHRARIDSQAFRPGEDFRDAIRRVEDESDLFVFFVSPRSLESSWVKFELDEAEIRSLRGKLRASLTIFIEGPIDPAKLPPWLARLRAVRHTTPGQSARTIESLLLGKLADHQQPFVGRHDDLQRGERKIATADPPPRVVIVSGLEGVGRRSYLAKLLDDTLSLDLGPVIVLPPTATIEDLFLESHLSSTMLTRSDAEAQLMAFRSLTPRDQGIEVADQLAFLARQGSAPCIVDRGAMLDSAGKYLESYEDVITRFLNERGAYLAIVHRRAPDIRNMKVRSQILERRLRPLPPPDTQALITRLLRDANVSAEPSQTARLAEVVGGYPPAAYFIVAQIEDYGLEVVLKDGARTADFHSRSFLGFLRDLKLQPEEREILIYLSSETRLGLAGIAAATGHSIERTAAAITQLVDLSVVEVLDGEYSVAAPIQTTVLRTEDGLGRRWYERAFKRLEAEYWSDERALPPITVVDATLRAGLRIGQQGNHGYSTFVRPSLLIHAAQEMYHRREFERALEYAARAEQMGGRTPQLVEVRIKALAQLGRTREARNALRDYRAFRDRRQWYLEGFVERKASDHTTACSKFQQGYSRGDRTVSLLRDYADSMLRTDALAEASSIAREALDREPSNIYVLDLIARIEIVGGSHEAAEQALDALEIADLEKRFVLLRRASYLLNRRGTGEAARRAITLATEALKRRDAPIEAHLVLARAFMRTKQWDRFDEVKREITRRRQRDAKSIIRQLELDSAITRGDWRQAEGLLPSNLITADERESKAAVLELKSVDHSILLTERQDAKSEAARLRDAWRHDARPVRQDIELYE